MFIEMCETPEFGTPIAFLKLAHMQSVLVVEDHFDTRNVLVEVLSSWGHEVRGAGSAAEGIDALNQSAFDVIVCDIGLPDETGWEMMKKVRAANKTICAVALTAYCGDLDRELSRAAGFNFHLTKPPDTARLQAVISGGDYKHYRADSQL
jgi:CheY-like chemotaxis protein